MPILSEKIYALWAQGQGKQRGINTPISHFPCLLESRGLKAGATVGSKLLLPGQPRYVRSPACGSQTREISQALPSCFFSQVEEILPCKASLLLNMLGHVLLTEKDLLATSGRTLKDLVPHWSTVEIISSQKRGVLTFDPHSSDEQLKFRCSIRHIIQCFLLTCAP